jgi:WD40 repeat protein
MGRVCVGEVEVLYLYTMKKQLFFLFLLFVSALSFAQSSLDSLRLVLPVGHTSRVNSAVFSPDGKLVVTASTDETARIYDVSSGKELLVLMGHKDIVHYATFSPNGKLIATVSEDNTARIWDLKTGKQIRILKGVYSERIDFSSNGNQLLTTGWCNFIVLNILTGKVKHLYIHSGRNKYLTNRIHLTGKFSSDGKVIMGFIKSRNTAGWDQNPESIYIWDANNGKKVSELVGHSRRVYSAEFSLDSKFVVSSGKDNITRIWEISSGKEIKQIIDNETFVYHSIFSLDNKWVFTCNEDGSIRSYEINSGKKGVGYSTVPNALSELILSPNGNLLIAKGHLGPTFLLNIQTKEIKKIPGTVADISPNSQYLMLYNKNSVCLYNINTCIVEKEYKGFAVGELDKRDVYFPLKNKIALSLSEDGFYLFDENLNGFIQSYTDTSFSNETDVQIISPNGDFLALTYTNNTVKIFNTKTRNHISTLTGHHSPITSLSFSSDSKKLITTGFHDRSAVIWDVDTGKKLMDLDHEYFYDGQFISPVVRQAAFSPDGHYAVTLTNNNLNRELVELHFWMLDYGIDIQQVLGRTDNFVYKLLDTFSSTGKITIRDTNYIARVYQFSVKENRLIEMSIPMAYESKKRVNTFILDASHLAKRNRNSYDILDISTMLSYKVPWKKKDHVFKIQSNTGIFNWNFEHRLHIGFLGFFPDNKTFLTTYGRVDLHSAQIWDTKSGIKLKDLEGGHSSYICDAAVCPDGSHVFTVSQDQRAFLWDVATGNPIYECILLENNNWLVKLPNSPYYMCSKDASKMLHYVTPSLKVIGFEQLDPVYNRPDIVLDSIGKYFGGADQELVANYRQSWEKRIDRLGLNKEKLGKGEIAVPSAEIVGTDAIAYENKAGKINIKVSANDPKYPLRRFNVFVNEVPLYGSAGISIAHLKKQVWDTTVSVPLSVGENKIQVSVMNELGLENFKYPTYVNYTPENNIIAKTHYIGIGVNAFQDSIHNLKYCVKDVRDLAREFATENKNVDTLLFTDKQVTKENILALKEYLNKTNVNDKVIISCSSHGLLDDSLNFYLAMHDVDFNNPKARGLKYEELESLLDGIPARQKLLLLDACNSGENDKTELMKRDLAKNQNKMDEKAIEGAKGVIIKLEEENKSNFKKMNELFVNVRNNTGSVIISAAGGQESALEGDLGKLKINNGAFTYSILEYLEKYKNDKNELTVNKLKQYVEKRVEEITNGKQKPTSRQETMEVDWGVKR